MKCGAAKPLSEFYRHSGMKDGHLGKCKECTKRDVRDNRIKNIDRIREYDRNRPNAAERKERNKENYRKRIATPEGRKREWEAKKKYINSTKKASNTIVGNAVRDGKISKKPCAKCGSLESDAHHENYYEPLNIIWLCKKHHGERHREINEEIRNGADWSDKGWTR